MDNSSTILAGDWVEGDRIPSTKSLEKALQRKLREVIYERWQ
jgi:hypothetical protein